MLENLDPKFEEHSLTNVPFEIIQFQQRLSLLPGLVFYAIFPPVVPSNIITPIPEVDLATWLLLSNSFTAIAVFSQILKYRLVSKKQLMLKVFI